MAASDAVEHGLRRGCTAAPPRWVDALQRLISSHKHDGRYPRGRVASATASIRCIDRTPLTTVDVQGGRSQLMGPRLKRVFAWLSFR